MSKEPFLEHVVIHDPSEAEVLEIRRKLQEYNRQFLTKSEEPRLAVKTLDADGNLAAGAVFTIVGQWVEIEYFWVRPDLRRRGLGRSLLETLEAFGRQKGCRRASLNTFDFQARPFYEKQGYRVVYTQRGYPLHNERYFMEKDFDPASDRSGGGS